MADRTLLPVPPAQEHGAKHEVDRDDLPQRPPSCDHEIEAFHYFLFS